MVKTDCPLLDVERVDGIVVVHFRCREIRQVSYGEADDLDRIRCQLYDLIETLGCPRLVLDLGPVERVASLFLGVLGVVQLRAARGGGRLALCRLGPGPRELMKVSGLWRRFAIYDDEAAALESF